MKSTKIITIITAFLILSIFSTVVIQNGQNRNPHRRITCRNNLKQIGMGLMMYAEDNNGHFPSGDNVKGLTKIITPYIKQNKVLICPKDKKRTVSKSALKEDNSSYIYLDIERSVAKVKYPLITVVAFDKPNNHRSYVNVLYMDGRALQVKTKKNYNCEAILTVVYKSDFSDPTRKLQLKKARAMDKKFGWKAPPKE